ncbi:hypothetical protein HDU86_004296 [Geranomyces michiganensis]|nr:hypothetical protein HDU86_004296 [Geranomyces michiganensis]
MSSHVSSESVSSRVTSESVSSHVTSESGQIYEDEARAKITTALYAILGTEGVLSDLISREDQPGANRKSATKKPGHVSRTLEPSPGFFECDYLAHCNVLAMGKEFDERLKTSDFKLVQSKSHDVQVKNPFVPCLDQKLSDSDLCPPLATQYIMREISSDGAKVIKKVLQLERVITAKVEEHAVIHGTSRSVGDLVALAVFVFPTLMGRQVKHFISSNEHAVPLLSELLNCGRIVCLQFNASLATAIHELRVDGERTAETMAELRGGAAGSGTKARTYGRAVAGGVAGIGMAA